MRVSFLVPAYNEASTIEEVLARIDALDLETEVVVVDDGSTDRTADVVERWRAEHDGIHLLRQPNQGKGAAVRAAIPHMTGEIAVIQDADMEYDPADVPALIDPILRGFADAVYGSRLSGGKPQRAYLFWHLVGNRILSLLTGVLYSILGFSRQRVWRARRRASCRDGRRGPRQAPAGAARARST
jgi:glycosyltransferase involved in cell wall biosynthesis